MSANPDPRSLFGHLWGSFQAAVNDPEVRAQPGGVQSYVWQSIRNDYLSKGEPLPAGSFQAVNALLSLAGAQRRASDALDRSIKDFQRTGIDSAITAEHLAPDIDSRGLGDQAGGALYRIRFEAPMAAGEDQFFSRFTWDPGLEVPQTISELLGGLDDAAAAAAEDYDLEYSGDAAILSITTV